MMNVRREILHWFLPLALAVPLGLAACEGDLGFPLGEEELAVGVAPPPGEPRLHIVEVEPEAAHRHMAAMNSCLRKHGIDVPDGPVRFRFHTSTEGNGPPGPRGGAKFHVRFKDGHLPPAEDEVFEIESSNAETEKAFAACIAEVGPPEGLRTVRGGTPAE